MELLEKSNSALTVRLLEMPIHQMMEALEAIEDLDQIVTISFTREADIAALHRWSKVAGKRRADRQKLKEPRLFLEMVHEKA